MKKGQMVSGLHFEISSSTQVQQLAMWHETGHRAEVTCICRSPQENIFAVGYADGSVRLWNGASVSVVATFNGHQKSVTALAFDARGTRLASGSQDTNIIVWDVVAEAGLYRYALSSF
jgi:U3 small nucleolar RNA-associated protein 12